MGKGARQKGNKSRKPQTFRKKQVDEVFKKGRKQRSLAKKLEDKINRRHLKAGGKKFKKNIKQSSLGNFNKAQVAILDKKLAGCHQVRKPVPGRVKVGRVAINSAIDCLSKMQLD